MPLLTAALLLALATSTPAPSAPAPQDAATTRDVPIPEKIPPPAGEDIAPTVTIRASENGDVIEEYRDNGQVYMVRITPVRGPAYYLYDDDRNGRIDRSDAEKNDISPVYWTIYEWD